MGSLIQFLTKNSARTGVYYIDSTPLEVCKNQRIYRHKTFTGLAERGMSSCGWFFGFKLHLITNHLGEIMGLSQIRFCKNMLFIKFFGDAVYMDIHEEPKI